MTMCCPTRAPMSSIWMISIALEALSTTRRSTRDDGWRVLLLVRGDAAALAGSATEIDAARPNARVCGSDGGLRQKAWFVLCMPRENDHDLL